MQRELDNLRQQVQSSARAGHIEPSGILAASSSDTWTTPHSDLLALQSPPASTNLQFTMAPGSEDSTLNSSIQLHDLLTVPQILDGQEYDPQRIDDCFTL